MPLVQNIVSVGASSTVENLLSGVQFEYLPRPCMLEIAIAQLSGSFGDVTVDISVGDTGLLAENIPIVVKASTAGNQLKIPDDIYMQEAAPAGARLKIRARNSTGGAISVHTLIRITWLR